MQTIKLPPQLIVYVDRHVSKGTLCAEELIFRDVLESVIDKIVLEVKNYNDRLGVSAYPTSSFIKSLLQSGAYNIYIDPFSREALFTSTSLGKDKGRVSIDLTSIDGYCHLKKLYKEEALKGDNADLVQHILCNTQDNIVVDVDVLDTPTNVNTVEIDVSIKLDEIYDVSYPYNQTEIVCPDLLWQKYKVDVINAILEKTIKVKNISLSEDYILKIADKIENVIVSEFVKIQLVKNQVEGNIQKVCFKLVKNEKVSS